MNLIVGSTGLLGMDICRQLARAAQPIRAFVRSTSDAGKLAELTGLGAELVEGDLKDPPSLRRACRGVEAVISTASSTFSRQSGDSIASVDELGQLALVNAAREAGVRRFVFISFRSDPDIQFPLSMAKKAVEQCLADSGIDYTVLQASYFMEVWLTPLLGFDPAHGRARIYGEGRNKISWISFKDVARIAVAALDRPAARNRIIEIGGPEALSPLEVVRIFEGAGAAEIIAEHVPLADLQSQFECATDPLQKSFAGLMLGYAHGDGINTTQAKALFPFDLASVRDYVSNLLVQH
jgi:NADH dehydrogenase